MAGLIQFVRGFRTSSMLGKEFRPWKPRQRFSDKKEFMADRAKKIMFGSRIQFFFQRLDLNAGEWDDVKYELWKHKYTLTVLPNAITRKMLENTKLDNLRVMFINDTAIAYGNELSWAPILPLTKHPKLIFMGARVDDMLLSLPDIHKIMALPNIDVLRGELLQGLISPAHQTSALLSSNQAHLSKILDAYVQNSSAPQSEQPKEN